MRLTYLSTLVLCLLTVAANATDRYYPDRTVLSPSGRLRLEAKSPDNVNRQPFAKDFVYTLYDTQSEAVIWQRSQPRDERSPIMAFVSDDGWVVVRDAGEAMFSLRPFTAEKTELFDILDALTEEEHRKYVSQSSAGPIWTGGTTTWNFVTHDERTFFVVRAWWGRRLIADLNAGIRLQPIPKELQAACEEHEKAIALKALRECNPSDPEGLADVLQAIGIAVQLDLKEAAGPLLEIERDAPFESNGLVRWSDEAFADGIDPFQFDFAPLRVRAQLALLMLGEHHAGLPGYRFDGVQPLAERDTEPPVPGESAKELLERLGTPDWIGLRHWEYDAGETTIRVRFEQNDSSVSDVEMVSPPTWRSGERWRDMMRGIW